MMCSLRVRPVSGVVSQLEIYRLVRPQLSDLSIL